MPLTLNLTTAPTVEPVTTSEAFAHMRLSDESELTLVQSLITAARQHVESLTERALITQTWTLKLDEFPCWEIKVPRPNLIAVSSITYVDTAGATQTLSSANYLVDASSMPGRITPAYGMSWPSTRCQNNAVTITFTAGYGAAAAVPQALKLAILQLVAHWFEFREPVISGTIVANVPITVDRLIGPFRTGEVY